MTSSLLSSGCCGCCKVTSCLSGDTIDTECCLSCDELIMWSERPSFSHQQKYFLTPELLPNSDCTAVTDLDGSDCINIAKIVDYTVSANELEPVQTIYSFYKTYWRPVNFYASSTAQDLPIRPDPICPDQVSAKLNRCAFDFDNPDDIKMNASDASTLVRLKTCLETVSPCAKTDCPPNKPDPDPTQNPCAGEEHITSCDGFYLTPTRILDDLTRGYSPLIPPYNCCYPNIDTNCGPVIAYPTCECNSAWLTHYRRRKLLDDYRTIWGVDIECYDEDSTVWRLADEWLFNMAFERWWQIAKDDNGVSQCFWNIPGSSGSFPNPTQTTPPNSSEQVDDLVPKFWIFACSAVPFFRFELEDAVNPMNSASLIEARQPVITSQDADNLIEHKSSNTPYAEYHLQSIFEAISKGGYFESKDWRAEQLQAYKELAARFPGVGYEQYANKTVDQMPELGPFRKRYYKPHTLGFVHPTLRPDKVPTSALPLQAEFYHQYPGVFSDDQQDIDDYYFWAERQWVYFRAVPTGWTWANWNAGGTLPCGNTGIGVAPSEDAAILAGCGRGSGDCIGSWYNNPQETTTTHAVTQGICTSYQGEGQDADACFDGSDYLGDLTPCACCRTICSIKFGNCVDPNASLNGCLALCQQSSFPQDCVQECYTSYGLPQPVPQCVGDLEQCLADCDELYCKVEYPIDQCTDTDSNCNCAPPPLFGCTGDECSSLNVNSYCHGVHIIAAQYVAENKMQRLPNSNGINEDVNVTYRCLWTANTFLTPAKNSYEYRTSKSKCTRTVNTQMHRDWEDVRNKHIVPTREICNNHFMAITSNQNEQYIPAWALQYFVVPACESGICYPWYVETPCCPQDENNCPSGIVNCYQRIQCVQLTHGKKWDARGVCPPSCGTDNASYGPFPSGYFGGDGNLGVPPESSCERDEFLGYSPECW